jgi:hypothetical protein
LCHLVSIYIHHQLGQYIFLHGEVLSISVLKPEPARRVDPGPSRPGPGTGPGGGKNLLGKTRSTQRVDPGPGPPGQTRVRPGQFFILF